MFHSGGAHTPTWPIVLTGGISSLVLALGMTPTFSAFTASIQNSVNGASSGILVMQERNSTGTVTCLSTDGGGLSSNVASCSTINKYGDVTPLMGAGTVTLTYIKNMGSVDAATFAFAPAACVQSPSEAGAGTATDLCSKITVSITSGATSIFSGSAQSLAAGGPIDVLSKLGIAKIAPGSEIGFTVTAKIDGTLSNAYQGLKLSQPMTWIFSS